MTLVQKIAAAKRLLRQHGYAVVPGDRVQTLEVSSQIAEREFARDDVDQIRNSMIRHMALGIGTKLLSSDALRIDSIRVKPHEMRDPFAIGGEVTRLRLTVITPNKED